MRLLNRFRPQEEYVPLVPRQLEDLGEENPVVYPNLRRRYSKALRPEGRRISINEEPLEPGVYIVQIQGRDVGHYDMNDGFIEYDPNRVQPGTIKRALEEYLNLMDDDIIAMVETRY